MNLQKEFEKETGKNLLIPDDYGGYYYSDDYVEWLEQKLEKLFAIPDVSGSYIVCRYVGRDKYYWTGTTQSKDIKKAKIFKRKPNEHRYKNWIVDNYR